ncbi:MAG: FAD-binding oxidoreductase [Anaerolineae bacterium]|nr:FAD-binding oxidoreductase [Anaerolineae bacterium]
MSIMDISNLRWWGWGTLDQTFSLQGRPNFWPSLRAWLELPDDQPQKPAVSLAEIDLRPGRLDDPVLNSLYRLLGQAVVRTDLQCRVEHAAGKSYRDLVQVRAGTIPNPPDAVVYPADEGQVAAILTWAADRDIAVVPFGGGSGVLGAVEPMPGEQLTLTLDTAQLDRLVALDRISHTARIQAGATGPEVERQLNEHGFTLGHFPQSFEFSTLGGWIATRAAGQTSTGYGKIEDMTQAVRLVTPGGIITTKNTPASAAGPSLLQMLIGSEGAYGVITEATMRVRPYPQVQDYRGFLFRSFADGIAALRDLMQSGLRPTIARLSDAAETTGFSALTHEHHGMRALIDRALEAYLKQRQYQIGGGSCLLLLGRDGHPQELGPFWKAANDLCADHRGLRLGKSAGKSWKRDRFAHPYLRDIMMDAGVMVDTLETATTWSNLPRLYDEMTTAVRAAIQSSGGGPGYVMTHISHVYQWGASLYTTFLGRQLPGREIEQWWSVKREATETILAAGGTLSHHHGVGRDHAEWLAEEVGPVGMTILQAVKQALDPEGIMNPGVLIPLGEKDKETR